MPDDRAGKEIARWERLFAKWARSGKKYRLLTPLPRRTRIRLAAVSVIDRIGAWLCGHHMTGAAMLLWRALGMMR